MLRLSRSSQLIAVCVSCIALVQQGKAHVLDTNSVVLIEQGDTATFTLADLSGCSALITAASTDISVVTVTPPGPIDAVVQTFTVTAQTGAHAVAFIGLQWVGEDVGGEGPCQEISGNTVTVTVRPTEKTTAETTAAPILPEDPVNSSSGEMFLPVRPDLDLGGKLPLRFERYYASHLERDALAPGTLGNNWRHNFDWYLTDFGNRVEVISARGQSIVFEDSIEGLTQGVWELIGDTETQFQLAGLQFAAEYTFLDPRSRLLYIFQNPASAGQRVPLKRIEDGKGNVLTVTQGASGISQISDGIGRTLVFSYTAGKMTGLGDGTRTVSYAYSDGNLSSFTDARGEIWSYDYDIAHATPGLLTAVETPVGTTRMAATWDTQGRVASQTLGETSTTALDYQATTTAGTQPLGQPVQHSFDSNAKLEKIEDEEGNETFLTYDSDGRRNSMMDADGELAAVTHDPVSGLPTSFTDFDGLVTSLTYASRVHASGVTFYDLTRIDHPDSTYEQFTYDPKGNILSTRNRLGETYTATYGPRGEVLTVTLPTTGVYTATYNADGTPATLTNPSGEMVSFGYDSLRRRISITYPDVDSSTKLFEHDARDAITQYTDPMGRETTYVYDENGNLESSTTPRGETTSFSYDALDRVLAAVAPSSDNVQRTYDALGRVSSMTDLNGHTWTITTDGRGAPIEITDPDGNSWSRTYSPAGHVLSETDPLGNTTTFEANEVGLLSRVTTPLGHPTEWQYGTVNDLKKIVSPLGHSWDYTFRPNQQASQISAGGGLVTTSWSYGALERVNAITDPNGEVWVQSHDTQGRLVSTTDPLAQSTMFAFDASNRSQTITFPGGMGTALLEFNRSWQLMQETYSDSTTIDFSYDTNGDLSGGTGLTLQSDSLRQISNSNGIAIERDAAGNITKMIYAEDREVSYVYDNMNRPIQVTDWLSGTTVLNYDDEGKLLGISRPNGVSTSINWDADGRLTGIDETFASTDLSTIQLVRDARGQITSANRSRPLSQPLPSATTEYSYDAASQVQGLQYDALGRVVEQAGRNYDWDLAGRLTGITENGSTVAFTYDALGQPVSRTENGVSRDWVWNYALPMPMLAIERESGLDETYYVTLPGGGLLYAIDASSGERRYYHYDEMGNTIFRTDETGTISENYSYAPYGEIVASSENSDNRFAFQGQLGQFREGDDLVFMRARWYDATTGRFLSRDPRNQSLSPLETMPYSYARQNPRLYVDPKGTNVEVVEGGIHTDIKVDVWCGNEIIGTLTAGFFPKCVATNRPEAVEGIKGFTYGADSAIKGNFTYGGKASPPPASGASSGNVFVSGSREADERLAKQILEWMGQDTDGKTAAQVLKEMYPVPKGQRNGSFRFLVDSTDTFGRYRIFTQVCNDFTDEALDTYYGYNWYLGSFHLGQTLIDQVHDYEQLRADGLPLGGFLYYDIMPAVFGGG